MTKLNKFNEQFKESCSSSDKEFWGRFLPDIDWDVNTDQDKQGLDCYVKKIPFQLKIRDKFYNDIAIEFAHSNHERGWIEKENQLCEWIAYGWRNHNQIAVFKWSQLVATWKDNRYDWINRRGFKVKGAENPEKMSYNLIVPFSEFGSILKIKDPINVTSLKI